MTKQGMTILEKCGNFPVELESYGKMSFKYYVIIYI